MNDGGSRMGSLRPPTSPSGEATARHAAPRELFVRHARRDGRSIAVLRAVDFGDSCVVETDVYPAGAVEAVHAGPYTFGDARQATAFVTEAVEALMYLGCDIHAS
ncbi:MAG: hypothetical protein QOK32_42 [Gaiellaceae bacterium]|jgi:hypothetical protein|nr:hypothetical protein [Gaiellaceae bacterium]MDX6517834.1 hypothetical protein [Gaiellaceae bacterium]MDX6542439.1 hypothetical protein [Gaiellaceae bacterium]